ncbi:MAG: hypothetical protein FWF57_02555 [Defluviitaleaceae bacterium]|nr:hypothetical protein [Defluviitaleaceae bacterium]
MSLREIFDKWIQGFFNIFGMSFFIAFLYSMIFNLDIINLKTSQEIFILTILIMFSYLVFYSKKPITRKQFIIRTRLCYSMIFILINFFGIHFNWINLESFLESIVFILLSILSIVILSLKNHYQNYILALKINQKIKKSNECSEK